MENIGKPYKLLFLFLKLVNYEWLCNWKVITLPSALEESKPAYAVA